MKRFTCITLVLVIILILCACENPEKNLIETKYFTMTVPDSWVNNYCVKTSEEELSAETNYTVCVYEKGSYERSGGGNLFDIIITADEYFDAFASGEKIDEVDLDGKYCIFVRYPSDVQFDDAGMEKYLDMAKEVEDVIASIDYKQ